MLFGSGAAVVLRIVLTVVAAKLLALPYLQIVGGLLLLWIGVQLLGDDDEGEGEAKEYGSLMAAVRTILIADLVMSLDNVIAVAAAAQGSMVLLILGLAISIPLVIFGSTLMIKLMERFPIIVHAGRRADRLGRRRNHRAATSSLRDVLAANPWLHYAAAAAGAAVRRGRRPHAAEARATPPRTERRTQRLDPWRITGAASFPWTRRRWPGISRR